MSAEAKENQRRLEVRFGNIIKVAGEEEDLVVIDTQTGPGSFIYACGIVEREPELKIGPFGGSVTLAEIESVLPERLTFKQVIDAMNKQNGIDGNLSKDMVLRIFLHSLKPSRVLTD